MVGVVQATGWEQGARRAFVLGLERRTEVPPHQHLVRTAVHIQIGQQERVPVLIRYCSKCKSGARKSEEDGGARKKKAGIKT